MDGPNLSKIPRRPNLRLRLIKCVAFSGLSDGGYDVNQIFGRSPWVLERTLPLNAPTFVNHPGFFTPNSLYN